VHGPALRRAAEFEGIVRIRLAGWEVGLADARGADPDWFDRAISGRVPVVQRESGAGVQVEFETLVSSADPIPGPRASSHLEAASRAVYGGIPAVTIEPAALAVGAEFRSFGFHETELWIAPEWRNERVVGDALDVIGDRRYQRRLEAIGGYDLSGFGTTVI
jgi:molybdate-binding protein